MGATAKPCPELKANPISKIFFFWITKLLYKGYKNPLRFEDLWQIRPQDACNVVAGIIERQWKKQVARTGWSATTGKCPKGDCGSIPSEVDVKEANEETKFVGETEIPHVSIETPGKKSKEPSLWRACFGGFGGYFMGTGVVKILGDALNFVNPQLLGLVIAFLKDEDAPEWKGYIFALAMFITAIVKTLCGQWYFHMSYRTGMRCKTSLMGALYRKSLRLSSGARRGTSVGELVNLMSVDCQRIQDAPSYLHNLWTAPIVLIVAIYFLWLELGPSALAGVASMILLIPINAVTSTKTRNYQIAQLKEKDQRIKLTNEMLNGMKVLKLYAWEDAYKDRLQKIREKELKYTRRIAYLGAATTLSFTLAPFLVSLSSFVTFVLSSEDNVLDAQKAFVSLALFNIMNMPLIMLPNVITMAIQVNVSLQRITKFMRNEELDPKNVTEEENEDSAIRIRRGTFSWDEESDKYVLKNICLRIAPGKLVAVVGTVGCGKSSLMAAMLGEMKLKAGNVHCRGSVAYIPQQAWIRNATVRGNILFGKGFLYELYKAVIEACALATDLEILTNGDETEIGEKGINLSGGQKQRISIARAVYQNSDIYILDDPLSAVDAHVGKHIFEQVIGPEGVLRSKTRVLVTNSLWLLPQVDEVVVLNEGTITERGSYQALIDAEGPFAEFVALYLSEIDTSEEEHPTIKEMRSRLMRRISCISQSKATISVDDDEEEPRKEPKSPKKTNDDKEQKTKVKEESKKLIQKEKEETGNVESSVVKAYFKACGYLPVVCIFISFLFYNATRLLTNVWLSEWSSDSLRNTSMETQDEINARRDMRLGIYGGIGLSQGVAALCQAFAVAISCLNASCFLHNSLLNAILRAPMSFFDTTPLGRIINRFSKDVDTLDLAMPMVIRQTLLCLSAVVTTIFIISYSTPFFLAAILPLGVLYYFIQRFYIATSRQLKRIESTQRSPIYTHFEESITGVSSIRAYGVEEEFIVVSDGLVDNNNIAYFPNITCNRWLGVYLELIGGFVVFFAALFVIIQRSTIAPGDAGLSISYALQVTWMLSMMVRAMCDLENNIVSVERVQEYSEGKQEAPAVIEDNRPPPGWPSGGEVDFQIYSTRYREGLDLVVKGITAQVKPGEKVGICGRTGAGKSSLTLALFRIIEAAEGLITIDGVDISKIGLKDLRSKLTIIPQDPVVFSGTLRQNLDPANEKTDEELWSVLELANMKDFVKNQPDGLSFMCSEGGENVSVGQRQLLCLGRALLRKTKVLVLDEATAAMDLATDDLIQNTLRTEFKECTILTIAHRLNTILDYDKIMVLDKGEIAEYGPPSELSKKTYKPGIFRSMLQDAGLIKDDK